MNAHRIAKILVGLIFGLLLVGGVVHNTGSSLACPDWPTCYGSLMPEMKGGVAIEHSHRLFAAAVGLLTIVLAVLLYKEGSPLRRLGLWAVFLVVFQGVLGGITVLFRLPDLISTAHLGTSFLFFALIIYITSKTSPFDSGPGARGRRWIQVVTALVFLQSLLGAFIRHTDSGLVCPDIPFCLGKIWPFGMHPMFQIHMAHRWLAVVVGLCVFSLPFVVRSESPKVKRLIVLACGTVLLQIGLGVASVLTHLGIVAVTGHLGGAALLWGLMVSLTILTALNPLPNRERVAAEGGRVREPAICS